MMTPNPRMFHPPEHATSGSPPAIPPLAPTQKRDILSTLHELPPVERAHQTRQAFAHRHWQTAAALLHQARTEADYWHIGCTTWRDYLDTIPITRQHANRLLKVHQAGTATAATFNQAYELARLGA